MGREMRVSGIALALAAMMSSAMAAEDCGPLKQVTSIDLIGGRNDGRFLVPVTINGMPKQMMLNTATGISNLQKSAVDAMGMHAIDTSRVRMLDSAGHASQFFVQADTFGMGAIHGQNMQFAVVDNAAPDAPLVGSLGGDLMSEYDVEMDFAGRKLNFFTKDHCPGHVLYWKPDAVAVVPISLQAPTGDSSRTGYRSYVQRAVDILVPVSLDGKQFLARINTASPYSTISANTAKFMFGVTPDTPDARPLGSLDGDPDHKIFGHVFSTLTFDAVTVSNPHFAVIPDLIGSKDPDNSSRTDSRIRRIDDNIGPQVTIGMDVLRKLRLFVAFSEHKLYVTPATMPVAAK
jgi:hypothetical protein